MGLRDAAKRIRRIRQLGRLDLAMRALSPRLLDSNPPPSSEMKTIRRPTASPGVRRSQV
jgi:hypothetical protein